MKVHAFRLTPGTDLKEGIETFVASKDIQAGFIITCVGGLQKAILRSADIDRGKPSKQDILTFTGDNDNNFEITSLSGTVSVNGMHLHMDIADKRGQVFGGHLKEGTIVHPTAEIILGEDETAIYTRELDPNTGFEELVVRERNDAS